MPKGGHNKKPHRIRQDTGIEEKHCSSCDTWKPLEAYQKNKTKWDNLEGLCRACKNAKARKLQREDYATEEGRKRRRAYVKKANKKRQMNGKLNAYRRVYERERRKDDSTFRTKSNMRNRIYKCFNKHGVKKNAKTSEIMGCTPEFLNAHLEKYFIDDMSWKNRGEWHIDHVVPCCAFGGTLEEQKILHWYDNLRPMWKDDNLHKSGNYKLEDKIALIESYNEKNKTNYMQDYLKEHYKLQDALILV